MNQKQRILTYVIVAIFSLTLFFVPWRVQNGPKLGYMISPYWRPVLFDEGGALRPMFLYAEWTVLAVVFVVLFFCLRNREGASVVTCMTATFTQTGGIRIGEGLFRAFNASWPFAQLVVNPKEIHLSCFSYDYSFPKESICRLSRHRGLFTAGLRIEHSVAGYPAFIVFWTLKYQILKKQLLDMGFTVDDKIARNRAYGNT